MKNLKRLAVLSMCAILMVAALTGCSGSKKAEFPSQAIRVIVPFSAGGNTDLNAPVLSPISSRATPSCLSPWPSPTLTAPTAWRV